MSRRNNLSADIIGQISFMLGTAAQLADESHMFQFLCRGLKKVPGTGLICYHAGDTGISYGNNSLDPSKAVYTLPVVFGGKEYGKFTFELADRDRFGDYIPYIENVCSMLGVLLESRRLKASEKALRLSNEQFRKFIENQPVGMFRTKIEGSGEILIANPAVARLFGYPSVEAFLSSRAIRIYEAPEQRAQLLEKLIKKESIIGQEIQSKKRDGTPITVRLFLQLVRDRHGTPVQVDGTVEDISLLKETEKQLRFTKLAFDNASIGIFNIGEDGRILNANKRACESLGYSLEEMQSLSLKDIDPAFPDEKFAAHRKKLKKIRSRTFETSHKRKDGSIFPVEVAVNFHEFEGEEISVSFQTDITERKRAEKALRQSETLHIRAQQIAKLGHWEWNFEDQTFVASDGYLRILEADREGFDGSPEAFVSYVHPDDLERFQEDVDMAKKKGSAFNHDFRIILPDGKIKHIYTAGRVTSDNTGTPVKILGTTQDITVFKEAEREREKTEKKLLQAQKMEAIGTLAGGIAHDFNNILTSIIGFTQIGLADLPEGHQARESLDQVFKAGIRARDLVNHILTFSRQSEQRFSSVKIGSVIKEAIKLLRASTPANIDIKYQLPSECCRVFADPVQIHQIIMNLCTNALHAIGREKGYITISMEETDIGPEDFPGMHDIKIGKYVKLCIKDNGRGMDQQTQNKIFDPYFTTKKKGEGTGLGLSVVHGIVKKHKGHITVYSEPGVGTAFYIFLPCSRACRGTLSEADQIDVPLGSEHLLVIDDEQQIIDMLTGMLNRLGYKVSAFVDAEDAIAFFKSSPDTCDLVITDMTMPAMTGDILAGRIRKINPDIPVIIQTGFSEHLDDKLLESIGVCAVLKKPVLEMELARSIRSALDL